MNNISRILRGKNMSTNNVPQKLIKSGNTWNTKPENYYLPAILAFILAYITYRFVIADISDIYSDYNGHLYIYLPMYTKNNLATAWQTVPYFMWHFTVIALNKFMKIPLESAAGFASGIYAVFSYSVIYWMLNCYEFFRKKTASCTRNAIITFCLCVVQGLYFPWLNVAGHYSGIFSMNPFHNPTQMCVQGLSLLCFALVFDIWGAQENENYVGCFFRVERGLKQYYIMLAVLLFLSVIAKPTFAEMFIPAVGIIMLVKWIILLIKKEGAKDYFLKKLLTTFFCALPSLGYMMLQFLDYFVFAGSYGESGNVIITKFGEVWSMFTENIFLSIILGMAFPILILVMDPRFFIKNRLGLLALVGYIIGTLEALLLGESGEKLSHGDFLWPMMSGMLILWITATMHLFEMSENVGDIPVRKKGTILKKIILACCYFLFAAHAFCGLMMYFNK